MNNLMNNQGYKYDPIKPIIYAKPERAHYCDIHKETFLFLQPILEKRQYKQTIKQILRILRFITKQGTFTKQDLINQCNLIQPTLKKRNLNRQTINKYLRLLIQLKLCKPKKRSIVEIKTNIDKKYVFTPKLFLKEIYFFIRYNYRCPLLIAKHTKEREIFNKISDFIQHSSFRKESNKYR